ncbi:MAG: HpcH/HpaI aldolase/citrate lyase family protein [Pseudomonadota bacterium]
MPAPKNLLKARMKAGDVLAGCWLSLANPYTTEVAATAGFDWLLLDGEHSPNDIPTLLAQLQVMGDVPAVVRLPDGDPVKIKQVLDIGAQSILIPMVNSAEEAETLVRACRFPPAGTRGVGAFLARASRFGAIPDYVATADAETCLIVQIESRAALYNLDAILAVEGVDAAFIGPADLAADFGRSPSDPEMRSLVMKTLTRIDATGCCAGVFSIDPDYMREAKDAGARFLGVGADITLLADALRARAGEWA